MRNVLIFGLIFSVVLLLGCLDTLSGNPSVPTVDPAKLAEFEQCLQESDALIVQYENCLEQSGAMCIVDPGRSECEEPGAMEAAAEKATECETQFEPKDCSNILN